MEKSVLLLCHGRNHQQDPSRMNMRWDVLDHDAMQRSVQVDRNKAAKPDICLDLCKASDLNKLSGPWSMIVSMNCVAKVHDVVVGQTGPRVQFWKWVAKSLMPGGTFLGSVSTFGLRSYLCQDNSRHQDTAWAMETWNCASTNAEPPSAAQIKALTKYADMYRKRVVEITDGRLRIVTDVGRHLRKHYKQTLPVALVFRKILI